jgi:hypothetical protein
VYFLRGKIYKSKMEEGEEWHDIDIDCWKDSEGKSINAADKRPQDPEDSLEDVTIDSLTFLGDQNSRKFPTHIY